MPHGLLVIYLTSGNTGTSCFLRWAPPPRSEADNGAPVAMGTRFAATKAKGTGVNVKQIGRQQRIEELELALAGIFSSPEAPAVSATDEGSTVYLQISWVLESQADTTLDSRCICTVGLASAQIDATLQWTRRHGCVFDTVLTSRSRAIRSWQTRGCEASEIGQSSSPRDDLFDVSDEPRAVTY